MLLNDQRQRHYGHRVGDTVAFRNSNESYTVIALDVFDNNKLYALGEDGVKHTFIAEWCQTLTKVEDMFKDTIMVNNYIALLYYRYNHECDARDSAVYKSY